MPEQKNKPVIVFTVTNDLSHDQRMIRICRTLAEVGYGVVLVGRNRRDSNPLTEQPYIQIRLPLWFKKGKLFYIEYNIRLFWLLLFIPCQAICSIDLDSAVPGILVCKWRGKTHFFDAHELFPHVPEVERRPIIQRIWQWVEKWVFSKTHVAYTVGWALADYFSKKYNKEVGVVCNMPLPRPMKNLSWPSVLPESLRNQKFMLYQGALNEGRGLELLLLAMKSVSIPLVLVGDGDIAHQLREFAKREGLNHVHFIGYVSPENLPPITQHAWLGINVSENAGLSYFMSLNNKFFDYVQDTLPSLINPFPEYLNLLKLHQVGIPCEAEVSQLIENIRILEKDPELYQSIKKNCIQASHEWNWDSEKYKLIHLYQNHLPVN